MHAPVCTLHALTTRQQRHAINDECLVTVRHLYAAHTSLLAFLRQGTRPPFGIKPQHAQTTGVWAVKEGTHGCDFVERVHHKDTVLCDLL